MMIIKSTLNSNHETSAWKQSWSMTLWFMTDQRIEKKSKK